MKNDPTIMSPQETAAWHEHDLSQLRYFRSLSLRSKLEAVQGMADVIRHFAAMREQGRFAQTQAASAAAGGSIE
jgi:hypothetical protein